MSTTFVVGLTGGVASGKSEVAKRFEALGIDVADADVAARAALAPGSDGLAETVAAFGSGILAADGGLDRAAMREFDNRILFQMSANDSSNLIDSPAANKLGFYRALAYSEEQGVLEKFRPYAVPSKTWLDHVRDKLSNRKD